MQSSLSIMSNIRGAYTFRLPVPSSQGLQNCRQLSLVRRQASRKSPLENNCRLDQIPRSQGHPHTGTCSSHSGSLLINGSRSSSRIHAQAQCCSTGNASSVPLTYTKPAVEQRQLAVLATVALLGFSVLSDDLPQLRLIILTYSVWAVGEWIVHRYFMHARSGSLADRTLHINKLHVTHHIDTMKDMTMKEGYDPNALYFHFPNTVVQVVVGLSVLAALDLSLDLSIPYMWLAATCTCFAITHNFLWNTIHLDMHEAKQELPDGIPCAEYERQGKWYKQYVQWVFNNHTTHHEMGGGVNYNVICPGPDLVLGTYYRRSIDTKL